MRLQKQPHHLITATHSTCSPPCARCCPRRHRLQTPCMTFAQQSRSTRGARRVVRGNGRVGDGGSISTSIAYTQGRKRFSPIVSEMFLFSNGHVFPFCSTSSFSLPRLFSPARTSVELIAKRSCDEPDTPSKLSHKSSPNSMSLAAVTWARASTAKH